MPNPDLRYLAPCVAAAMSLALVACGGGGGGGGTPQPAANAAPAFGTLSFAVSEDSSLSGRLAATDPEGGALTFSKTSDPANGTVTAFASDGSFTYRGNADFFGTDSFGVRVTDPANNAVNATATITVTAVNDPPRAANDFLAVTTAGAASLDVLANDRDVDGDPLTVTLEGNAVVGTATVNADRSVRLALPSGFRGATGFEYRITEPGGGFVRAKAVVFVDAPAYRVVLPLAPLAGTRELFLHDLIDGAQLGQATQGALRLDNYAASVDGSTVVFTRSDPAQRATTQELFFVRTRSPATQVQVPAPVGTRFEPEVPSSLSPVLPLAVSHDGRWLAFIATPSAGGAQTTSDLFVYDTQNPATPAVRVGGAEHAYTRQPRFSATAPATLYFLASSTARNSGEALYRVDPSSPANPLRLSAAQSPGTLTSLYVVSADQAQVVLWTDRPGLLQNLYRIDAASPGTETRLSTNLAANEWIPNIALSRDFSIVAYAHEVSGASAGRRLSRVNVSGTPAPVVLATAGVDYVGRAADIRPDNGAVLFTRVSTPAASLGTGYEVPVAGGSPTLVMAAPVGSLQYDLAGDQVYANGPPARIAARPGFATPQNIGFPTYDWFLNSVGPQRQSVAMSSGGFVYLLNLSAPDVALQLTTFAAAPQPAYFHPPLLPVGPAPAN